MEVLLIAVIAVMGAVCSLCFVIGAKVGQKVVKNEEIKLPSVNPVEAVREHKARKEAEAEQRKVDKIMANIDRYDGTGFGQEDIPGGR